MIYIYIYIYICDKRFVWNSSNCKCKYDKSCEIGQYLDYKNIKCREKVVDKCRKNIDKNELIYNGTENDCKHARNSCPIHIILFVIFFTISISIISTYIYFLVLQKK